MNRLVFVLILCSALCPHAFGQQIGIKVKNLTLKTVEESRNRYDTMDPAQVAGLLTYDGIILPIVLMDREGTWHQVPYGRGVMDEVSDFTYYAHSRYLDPYPIYTGREVSFSFETSYFSGFLVKCPKNDPDNPCTLGKRPGGIALTWKDKPVFFEKSITVEADSFQYHAPVLEAFLAAEAKHIDESPHYERNGRFYTRQGGMGIPVYKPERDSAIIQITYSQSGVLKDSLHLFYIETRREFPKPCRKSTQSGLLLVEGDQIDYIPGYYYAGECWSKESAGSSHPIAAFMYQHRIFLMEEHYGYEGMSYSVNEVLAERGEADN